MEAEKIARVKIFRKKAGESKTEFECFTVEYDEKTTVVAMLSDLNSRNPLLNSEGKQSRKIDFEHSCNQKQCGGCAMVINDTPCLACEQFVGELCKQTKDGVITLEPLSKFPNVQDLRVDRSSMYENIRNMKLWINENADNAKTLKKNDMLYVSASCIMCGCCLEVCPNYVADGKFYGASVMHIANRMITKENDKAMKKELKKANRRHGTGHCSKSLSCEKVCPAKIPLSSHISNLYGLFCYEFIPLVY